MIMCIMIATVYQQVYSNFRDNEMRYNVDATNHTKEKFTYTLDLIYKTGQSLKENNEIKKSLTKTSIEENEISILKNQISQLLNSHVYTLSNITGIHIVGNHPWQFFSSIPSIDEEELRMACFDYFNQKDGKRMPNRFTGQKEIVYYPGVVQRVIQYMLPVYDATNENLQGVILIDLSFGMLEEMFLASSKQSEDKAFVLRSDGEVIFTHPYNIIFDSVVEDYPHLKTTEKSQFVGTVFSVPMLIVSEMIDKTDWHIVRMMPMNQITKNTNALKESMSIVALLCMIISILFSGILAQLLTKPITKLLIAFQKAEKGNLSTRVHIKTNDELSQLGAGFNQMMGKLEKGIEDQLETQKKKSDMELEVLQAQINPHFLYNSLDSIKWLAMLQGVENIESMTGALISLLRYNLSKDGIDVTLKDEIESVENYITMQKYRYGDVLILKKEIDDKALDFPMLRFLVQPLVENCIVHGFNQMNKMGEILIRATVVEERLYLWVIDNGKGMDVEKEMEPKEGKDRFSNIGIVNIQERLRLHFGNDGSLSYESEKGIGTTALLIIPLKRKNKTIES